VILPHSFGAHKAEIYIFQFTLSLQNSQEIINCAIVSFMSQLHHSRINTLNHFYHYINKIL